MKFGSLSPTDCFICPHDGSVHPGYMKISQDGLTSKVVLWDTPGMTPNAINLKDGSLLHFGAETPVIKIDW